MAFQITELQSEHFPDEYAVENGLSQFGLPFEQINGAIEKFTCPMPQTPGQGYQQVLAAELERYLKSALTDGNELRLGSVNYNPRLNERADLALMRSGIKRKIFIEIEFRPNVEKDLIKFEIGHKSELLAVAVLIMAINRKDINPSYITMPEFAKFQRIIKELRPEYPLLLIGISGRLLD